MFLHFALAVSVVGLVGCGDPEDAPQADDANLRLIVVSGNYPLHYFAQRIGGDAVEAVFLMPPDVDPAFWQPTSDDIERMQGADVILLNGATYESWLPKVSLPGNRRVDTSVSFHDRLLEAEGDVAHQHGPGGEHTHGDVAFTTWMDLSLAIAQAKAVAGALTRVRPGGATEFEKRLSKLTADMAMLDMDLVEWGLSVKGQPLIGSHPVYQYFARRYGLNLKSVHWEPDVVPDAGALAELDALLKEHPAKLMIWEGEPAAATVEILNQRGIESVVVSPCGNVPEEGDFISVMRQNLANLSQ
jgi:zinc transport system substrate-binding protein